jgi:hypothetical protein
MQAGNFKRAIVAFHTDQHGDWVADLECGHMRHVRNNPPWTNREWVLTEEGRSSFIGHKLECVLCERALDLLERSGLS